MCSMSRVFPLPLMFNVGLQKTVAGWGQTKHVNYATPTPPRACQHWTLGARGSDTFVYLCFVCCVILSFLFSLMLRTFFRQPSVFCSSLRRVAHCVLKVWLEQSSCCVSLYSSRVFRNAAYRAHDSRRAEKGKESTAWAVSVRVWHAWLCARVWHAISKENRLIPLISTNPD